MEDIGRRRLLRTGAAAFALGTAGCSASPAGSEDEPPTGTGSTGTDSPTGGDADSSGTAGSGEETTATGSETVASGPVAPLGVEAVARGFTAPVGFESPAGLDWSVVVDQVGVVHRVDSDGATDTYLDLRDSVVDVSGYSERGLLGLAFHPAFADNGRLYVRYSAPRRTGTPLTYSHTFVLAEFTVDPAARSVSAERERTVLEIPQPQSNHNAGSVVFGPDGYLYVGVGDGGGANDRGTGHVSDWYGPNDGGNGQDVRENLLGSVLRVDVDGRDGERGYAVPGDNPLVGRPGLDEQYAWGFRNPWGMSFDGADLYVADVGQNRYEEVNLVVRGGNYGWNVREGAHCFGAGSDDGSCPGETPEGDPLRSPVVEYPHGGDAVSGVAVVGGYRYRGSDVPGLRGRYVFADWRSRKRLFVATPGEGRPWSTAAVPVESGAGTLGEFVLAFGRDADGELYVLTSESAGVGGETGAVHRLVPA
jgi:glucose/arabinose dehydrogenase